MNEERERDVERGRWREREAGGKGGGEKNTCSK